MNLDELNTLFASAWSSDEKALMFEGLVRGSNGTVAPESAPGPLKEANALALKWRAEAEEFLRKAEEGGRRSAAARASRFGTSQPPSGNSRTPFEESSNQATSDKRQENKEQVSLASLEEMPAHEQQPEKAASSDLTRSQAFALPPEQSLSSRATPIPPSGATPFPQRNALELEAEEMYRIYPLKVGKAAAIKAITKAIKKDGYRPLMDATIAYAEAVKRWTADDRRFIPQPATWFNQARYFDDRSTWVRTQRPATGRFTAPPQAFAKL